MPNARRAIASALLLVGFTMPAVGDDWQLCRQLSFAPLDSTVPACSRLIGSNALSDDELVTALLARADAYLFARTYRSSHKVDPGQLLASASADLDRAVAVIRKGDAKLLGRLRFALSERASVLLQLGKAEEAARDYSEVLRSFAGEIASTLLGRALAMKQLGRYRDAIADMDALIRVAEGTSNFHNMVFMRGELLAAAGDRKAAIEDFRRVLELDPQHIAAAEAIKKLGGVP